MWSNILDRISFLSLYLVIVLLPVFFLPFTQIPIETSKMLVFVVGLAVSIIFWALARFSDGRVVIPRSTLLLSGFGVVSAVLASAIFSSAQKVSLFGTLFDIGTFWYIFAGFLLMFTCSIVLRDTRSASKVLFGTIISASVVMIFQICRFFFPAALSFGILGAKTDTIFGSWNAFGIFAGLSALICLLVIEFFSTTKRSKMFFGVLTILSLVAMAAVNFMLSWELLGVFSLIIFIYKVSSLSRGNTEGAVKHHFPAFSFAVVMVCLLFFMSAQFIGGAIPARFGLVNVDPSPNMTATASVAKQSFAHSPILGIGPNRFADIWSMYKPVLVNLDEYWDVSFNHGSGLIPTLLATTGYLGIAAWVLFFGLLIISGIKSIFANLEKGVNKEVLAFFVLAIYLFLASFFYSVGSVLFLLALAFTGIFIGLSASYRPHGHITMLFLDDHRKSFFSILLLVVLLVASAAAGFKFIERFASVPYYAQTIQAFQTTTENPNPRIEDAQLAIAKTLSLYVNDLYLRTYSQVYLGKIAMLAQKQEELTDTDKTDLETSLQEAVRGAQAATLFDNGSHINFQALGNVYSTALSLGVKDVYEKAIEAYTKATELNPVNPGIQLSLAAVAFTNGKIDAAKEYAKRALILKPDYLDAFVTLAQIYKNEGDNKTALDYANQALSIYPKNQDLINYVNALKSNTTPPVIPETPTDTKTGAPTTPKAN